MRNSTHTLSSNISRHLHASLSSLYIYNLMQHDIGHVMHDAGSDKCWVALTVGTTCGPGRHKSCQKLCRVRFPQVRPRLTESVGIHWKHLYRALITYTMDPEFGCDSSEGKSWQEPSCIMLHWILPSKPGGGLRSRELLPPICCTRTHYCHKEAGSFRNQASEGDCFIFDHHIPPCCIILQRRATYIFNHYTQYIIILSNI